MKHGAITAILAALALAGFSHAAPVAPTAPKLVVAIAIDQFSAELFDRYRQTYTAGLKRIASGQSFTGYQSHAATETCPGHSTILTGRHPSGTGIVANSWFDLATGSSIYCVAVKGTSDPNARGPQNLKVDTLGDWLKGSEPGSRTISVSGKDRAAIMLAGHHADAVYWWVDGQGFATSPYAGPATPEVVRPALDFNQAVFSRWSVAPPALWPTPISSACGALVKPHVFGKVTITGDVPPAGSKDVETGPNFLKRTDFQEQLRASPAFDNLTIDFVDTIIDKERLGRGPATDLLAISLSATDYIGHRYGNGGAEMCVQMQAVDQALGRLLAKLDSLGVAYRVVLTADHGAIDAAEREVEHDPQAQRIDSSALVGALNTYLEQTLGLRYEPIVGDDAQQLFINVPDPDAAFRAKVRDLAVAWLRKRPEVAAVFTADEVIAAAPPTGKPVTQLTLAERFHESYFPGRSGDIQTVFKEFSTLGMPRGSGDVVAGHGTPWDYDRRVPVLFWWPEITPAQNAEPVETVDIAPTLAALAGVTPPPVDGHCLSAVTMCPPR